MTQEAGVLKRRGDVLKSFALQTIDYSVRLLGKGCCVNAAGCSREVACA